MKVFGLSFALLITAMLFSCSAKSSQDQKTSLESNDDLKIYYFHFAKRCATCNAVEDETKAVLDLFFSDQVKEGDISFTSLSLEDEDGKERAKQLQVSGQSLLLVKGDQIVNLTNEGFMNARTKPDKFHEVLKSQIDKLL